MRGSPRAIDVSWHRRRSAGLVLVFAQNLFGSDLNAFFLSLPGIDKVLHFAEYVSWSSASTRLLAE